MLIAVRIYACACAELTNLGFRKRNITNACGLDDENAMIYTVKKKNQMYSRPRRKANRNLLFRLHASHLLAPPQSRRVPSECTTKRSGDVRSDAWSAFARLPKTSRWKTARVYTALLIVHLTTSSSWRNEYIDRKSESHSLTRVCVCAPFDDFVYTIISYY